MKQIVKCRIWIGILLGGCADFCEYHVADQSDEENGVSYCRYFDMNVHTKHNCPYYKDMIGDLAKTLNSIMEKESRQ